MSKVYSSNRPNRPLEGAESNDHDYILYPGLTIIYSWPLMVTGYLLVLLHGATGGLLSLEAWSSIYVLALFFVIVTFCFPIRPLPALVVILVAALGYLLYPPILGYYGKLIYSGGTIDVGLALHVSNFLLVALLGSLFYRRLRHYKVERGALLDYRAWGRSPSYPCAGKEIRPEFPSVLKSIVGFGAGNLVVYDTNGKQVLYCLSDVPFLYFRYPAVERRLRTMPVYSRSGENAY